MTDSVCETAKKGRRSVWFRRHSFVSHPLLLLMPFVSGVPGYLTELQGFAHIVLDESIALDERIEAAMNVMHLAKKCKALQPEKHALVRDLMDVVLETAPSLRVIELLVRLDLEQDGYQIVDSDPHQSRSFAARLEKDGERLLPGTQLNCAAVERITRLMENLECMTVSEISELGPRDCVAGILLMWLHVQHSFYRRFSKSVLINAITYFATTGTSIWTALHAGVDVKTRATIEHFDDRFGVAAFNQIRHRVLADDQTSIGPLSAIQPPTATGAETGTLKTLARRSGAARKALAVITEKIPDGTSSEDRETIKRFSALCRPQPIALMPSASWLIERENRLLDEFPWAARVVRGIFQDLIAKSYCGVSEIAVRPILILGAPGIGKTRLARRIAEELALPFLPLGLAGTDDSRMILGTSRGWATGQPSPLLDVLLRHGTSSALVLLDEIEKTTNRSHNSPPTNSVLLGLLEPESVCRWVDSFLQVKCDLSRLIFVATANSLTGISRPLLSRFVILQIEQPTARQLLQAIPHVVSDLTFDWGLESGFFPEVHSDELGGKPKNMRELRLLVQDCLREWVHATLGPNRVLH